MLLETRAEALEGMLGAGGDGVMVSQIEFGAQQARPTALDFRIVPHDCCRPRATADCSLLAAVTLDCSRCKPYRGGFMPNGESTRLGVYIGVL